MQLYRIISLLALLTCGGPLIFAADLGSSFEALVSEDYDARHEAREEIAQAVAAAGAPGTAAAGTKELREQLLRHTSADHPEAVRDWSIRQLTWIATGEDVAAMGNLLNDPNPRIRDVTRKTLGKIGGPQAASALIAHLSAAPEKEDALGAIQALGSLETAGAQVVAAIAPALAANDAELARTASIALARVGSDPAREALLRALPQVSEPQVQSALRLALLSFELPRDLLVNLVTDSSAASVRDGAFAKLAQVDPDQALQIYQETTGPEKLDFQRTLMQTENGATAVREAFADLSPAEQRVALATAGQLGLKAFEPLAGRVLAESEDENLRTAALHCLIRIAGSDSWETLMTQHQQASGATRELLERAIGAAVAPELDQQLLTQAASGAPADRARALEIMELRNPTGTLSVLNQVIGAETEPAVVEAAVKTAEKLGNFETLRIMINRILKEQNPEILKQIQLSAKRVSAGVDDPERVWDELFEPVLLDAGADDEQKERLVLIADAAPTPESLDYLENSVREGPPTLRTAAVRNLVRWSRISAIDTVVELLQTGALTEQESRILWSAAMRILTGDGEAEAGWDEKVARAVALFKMADAQRQKEILEYMKSKAKYHTNKAREAFTEADLTPEQKSLVEQALTL